MAIHSIELCAGVGMFGEATRAAFDFLGIEHRTICYVEREAAAAGQLATLMEAGIIDPAPVWSDLLTFDGRAWRGKVDCLLAGFPCQDLSIAGRRSGLDGERSGLFFDICDLADDCGTRLLILENVSAIASATATVVDQGEELDERAASRVMGELADRGWDSEWITIRASDVGASHQRARWFCFAWRELDNPSSPRCDGTGQRPTADQQGRECLSGEGCEAVGVSKSDRWRKGWPEPAGQQGRSDVAQPDSAVADTERSRRTEAGRGPQKHTRREPQSGCGAMANPSSQGRKGREQRRTRTGNRGGQEAYGPTEQLRSALPIFAPGPEDDRWTGIIEQFPGLAPATESGIRMLVDGTALVVDQSRPHQLRAIGNGCVPLQAAVAIVELFRRSGIEVTT